MPQDNSARAGVDEIKKPDPFAEPPATEELDEGIGAHPWILRKRLTRAAYAARCRREGREPTEGEYLDHVCLTDGEHELLNDLVEARRESSFLELGPAFVIRDYGNKPRVGWFTERGELATMSYPDFINAHAEKMHEVGHDDDGQPILKPLVPIWLRHPTTRRYASVEYRPGVGQQDMPGDRLNLWRGWPDGLTPGWEDHRLTADGSVPVTNGIFDRDEMPPGYCDRFLAHMRDNMCGGDPEVMHYLLGWMADGLWNPGSSETAVVLRGPQGSGKTLWAKLYMQFFRPHSITLNRPQQLTGNFNAHLMDKSVVFADEAFFAGNRQDAASLKTLITDDEFIVEPKGVNSFVARKSFRVIIASNDEHVVRAEVDDRRFLVLNVDAGEHNNDKAHFGALVDEWNSGGRSAFFRWLTGAWWGRAVGERRFRQWPRPVTAALSEQKNLSLPPAQMVVFNMLWDGEVPCPHRDNPRQGTVFVPTDLLARAGGLRPGERKALAQTVGVLAGEGAMSDRATVHDGRDSRQRRGHWLPPLDECRRRFEQLVQRDIDWPASVTGWDLGGPNDIDDDDDLPF